MPILILFVAAAALFGPILLQGKALYWGTPLLQFVPWWSWAWQTVLSGHLPLWNPLLGMGAPLIANYQSALFYPPNWLYLLFYAMGGTALLAWGQALLVSLHLVWAGLGMTALVRRLGLGVLSQAIAGLAFGFCGYLVSRAGFLSINATVAWLPWVLLCLTPRQLNSYVSLRRFSLLTICLAFMLLAGHAQTSWYILILAGIWTGFISWETSRMSAGDPPQKLGRRGMRMVRSWGWLLVALAFAVVLTAVQLFPTAEYLMLSQRAEAVDYELAMTYSFWPWRLIGLLAPDFFGHPAQGDYWGYANYWEDAIYIGVLPLLLAIAAVLGSFRRSGALAVEEKQLQGERIEPTFRNHLTWLMFALFWLVLLLALGQNTPVFPWLYHNIPTFDLFQAPTRIMIIAEFALVILAALGAEGWRRPEGRGLYWTRLGTAGAIAVTVGAGAAWYFMGNISPSFVRATALAGLWGLIAGILSLLAPLRETTDEPGTLKPLPLEWWQTCVITAVALNLIVAGWQSNPAVDMDVYRESPNGAEVEQMVAGSRLYLPEAQESILKFERFLRFDTFDTGEDWMHIRATMLPNIPMLSQIKTANNFDPMLPGRYASWMSQLDHVDYELQQSFLELMDVRIVERVDLRQPYGVRYDLIEGGKRARWVPCTRFTQGEQDAWDEVMSGEIDFQKTVVLEVHEARMNPFQGGEDCPEDNEEIAEIQIVSESPSRVDISIVAPMDGWLVLSDTWYPGWRASLDGTPVNIYPANYLFRAVNLPAGEHRVQFLYHPTCFWIGLILSVIGCCLLIVVWWRSTRSNER